MPRRLPLSVEAEEVLALVSRGGLNELEVLVREGRKLRFGESTPPESTALVAAVRSGFRSLVQFCLAHEAWSQDELDLAVGRAMEAAREDLVDLLLARGASTSAVDFRDVCATLNLPLMERLARLGVDPAAQNGFARALHEMKARPLLRFYREHREEFPVLHLQACLALSEAVAEEKVRWVALLRWAGADPFQAVPESLYRTNWDPQAGLSYSAAWRAIHTKEPGLMKALKLRPTAEQARELLRSFAWTGNPANLTEFLTVIPRSEINDPLTNSSDAVEALVYARPIFGPAGEFEARVAQSLEILLEAGARYSPPRDRLGWHRRDLQRNSGRHVVRVVRLLLYVPGAADRDLVLELVRTPVMRQKIANSDPALHKELSALLNGA